jgi:hypothetical protein
VNLWWLLIIFATGIGIGRIWDLWILKRQEDEDKEVGEE